MKSTSAVTLLAICLTACDNPNIEQATQNLNLDQLGEIGTNLLVNAAKTECENQMNNQEGSITDLVLTQEQKANICNCATNELKNNINAENLQNIIKDGNIDTGILTDKITKAMATCTTPIEQAEPSSNKVAT